MVRNKVGSVWTVLAMIVSAASVVCCGVQDESTPNDGAGAPEGATPPGGESTPPAGNNDQGKNETPGKVPDTTPDPPTMPPTGPKERTILAIDSESMLVTFLVKDPSKVTTKAITGLAQGETILGIDVRPSN